LTGNTVRFAAGCAERQEERSVDTSSTRRVPWSRRVPAFIAIAIITLAGTAHTTMAGRQVSASHTPHQGGTLSIRTIGPDDCFDGEVTTTNVANQIDLALLDPLLTEDQHGKPSPDLATRWTITNGGKVVTFYLRHGVRFSNGDPFNADSVKWNFDWVLNPKNKSPWSGALGPLKAIRVLNPYAIQLDLKTPYRPLLVSLSSLYLGMVDPKTTAKLGSHVCSSVVGTGPFKLQSVGPGFNPVTVVRNVYHTWSTPWGYNHHPAYLNKIIFKPFLSDATAISELITGGVQVSEVAPSELPRVQHNPNIVIKRYPDEGEYYLWFNEKHPPFNSAAVRRAVAEAVSRNTLVKAAVNGLGLPAYSFLPARVPNYDPQSPKYAAPYNPSEAARILKAHNVTGNYSFVTFNDPTSTLAGELIQSELGRAGMKVQVQPHSAQDAIAQLDKGSFDILLGYYSINDADSLYLSFSPGAPGLFYTNPTLTKYVTDGRENTNPAAVRQDYYLAQRFINQNTLADPLFSPLDLFGLNKRVHGWHIDFFTLGYTVEPLPQDLWVSK
jgi:peptide/nickel transport system substrate-binding protein